jgi:cell division protein FtsL
MVVHGHGEHTLGALLADDIFVENLLDFVRLRKLVPGALRTVFKLFPNDVVAELDALVANEYRRARDELANLVLALSAEGAVQKFAVVMPAAAGVFTHRWSPS